MIHTAPFPSHTPLFINSVDAYRDGIFPVAGIAQNGSVNAGSNLWPTANLAIYVPIRLPWNYPVNRIFIANGGAAVGNFDIGLFKTDGTKIVSTGAIAQAGTSVIQYVAASWLIPKGSYYMGLSLSSASGSTQEFAFSIISLRHSGILQQAAAHPLPATMVGVTVANAYLPVFGFTRTSSGF